MLYLLLPDLTMKRSDLRAFAAIKARGAEHVHLDRLSWKRQEHSATTDELRWALRHGLLCSKGLLLDGPAFSVAHTPEDLKRAYAEFEQADVWPAGAQETMRMVLEEAQEELDEALAVEPDGNVLMQWQALGGPLPRPV